MKYKYILKKVIGVFLIINGELILVFYLANVAAPNPAAVWAGPEASPAQVQLVTQLYHLDSPWYVQLYYYMINFYTGNWGISPVYQTPVISLIEQYLPITLQLAIIALILKLILEIPLGVISALRPNGFADNMIKVSYTIARSFPSFLIAIALLFAFSYILHILPSSYPIDPIIALNERKFGITIGGNTYNIWLIDNMPILNSILTLDLNAFISSIAHTILPSLSLVLFGFGGIVRLVRNTMVEVLQMDFIKTARSKGLKERSVIMRHALKNSLLPIITISAIIFSGLMQGSLIVETIFNYYGLGYYLAQSILNFDTPSIIAGTVIITAIVLMSNLVADILYTYSDPRVREAI
jgi:ABC-type dipeptide/oligopeptide/nickel transport systems, permease components